MTEKRFSLSKDTEWWFVQDNAIQVNKYGYRDDLTGEDEYRGLHQELTEQETVDLLNELHEENQELKQELHKIYELATVDKVRDIVENVYDDLLYETSDESDYARTKVLKCLEDIDNLRDDLE